MRLPVAPRSAAALATATLLVTSPLTAGSMEASPTYVPPPHPTGGMSDLGSPLSSLTVVEGGFGTLPDGRSASP